MTLTEQILLFCNPCRVVGRGRLNLHGLQHLGICKEETHKFKQVLVLNSASLFLEFDFQSNALEMVHNTSNGIKLLVVVWADCVNFPFPGLVTLLHKYEE